MAMVHDRGARTKGTRIDGTIIEGYYNRVAMVHNRGGKDKRDQDRGHHDRGRL